MTKISSKIGEGKINLSFAKKMLVMQKKCFESINLKFTTNGELRHEEILVFDI